MSAASNRRRLYCCGCSADVVARLTDGKETYPHRPDLHSLPFWRCDGCNNQVGCHHKTKDRTKPLGVIPDGPMKKARSHIHAILDPIWKQRRMSRGDLYARLSVTLGREYHTGELRTLDEARLIYRAVLDLTKEAAA